MVGGLGRRCVTAKERPVPARSAPKFVSGRLGGTRSVSEIRGSDPGSNNNNEMLRDFLKAMIGCTRVGETRTIVEDILTPGKTIVLSRRGTLQSAAHLLNTQKKLQDPIRTIKRIVVSSTPTERRERPGFSNVSHEAQQARYRRMFLGDVSLSRPVSRASTKTPLDHIQGNIMDGATMVMRLEAVRSPLKSCRDYFSDTRREFARSAVR